MEAQAGRFLLASALALCGGLLAPGVAFATGCEPCRCDPTARQVVLQDNYGNQVVVTSYMPLLDPEGYRLDVATIDVNGDGLVSRAEASWASESSAATHNLDLEFHAVDLDGDGLLTPAELAHW